MAGIALLLVVAFLATSSVLSGSKGELEDLRQEQERLLAETTALRERERLNGKSDEEVRTDLLASAHRVRELLSQLEADKRRIEALERRIAEAGGYEDRIGVQRSLVRLVAEELTRAGVSVDIDEDTGTLIVPDNVLFKRQSATLPASGRRRQKVLDIGRAIVKLLKQEESARKIARIEVSGHTDKTGGLALNLLLSRARAGALVDAWVRSARTTDPCIVGKLLPVGMGPSRPLIADESAATNARCGDERDRPETRIDESRGCARNRRIEISILPKDPTRPEIPGCP